MVRDFFWWNLAGLVPLQNNTMQQAGQFRVDQDPLGVNGWRLKDLDKIFHLEANGSRFELLWICVVVLRYY